MRCEVAARLRGVDVSRGTIATNGGGNATNTEISETKAATNGDISATNHATNNTTNGDGGATNAGSSCRTLNRRKRGDYNAYQKELMRKRRAAAKAGFSG